MHLRTTYTRLALIAVAAAGALGAAPGPARAADPPVSYTDPAGDSKSAPDITGVVVTPGDGTVTIEVDVATVQDLANSALVVSLDTDRNASTGDKLGGEFTVIADSTGAALVRSDMTAFDHHPTSPSLSGGKFTLTLTLSDLGTTSFDFRAGSVQGDDIDLAPDSGVLTYPQQPATQAVVQVKGVVLPASALLPKAGKTYTLSGLEASLTDGTIVTPDTVTCTLTFKGRSLKQLGTCSWAIPKSYRKKRLTLTVHVTSHGATGNLTIPVFPK